MNKGIKGEDPPGEAFLPGGAQAAIDRVRIKGGVALRSIEFIKT